MSLSLVNQKLLWKFSSSRVPNVPLAWDQIWKIIFQFRLETATNTLNVKDYRLSFYDNNNILKKQKKVNIFAVSIPSWLPMPIVAHISFNLNNRLTHRKWSKFRKVFQNMKFYNLKREMTHKNNELRRFQREIWLERGQLPFCLHSSVKWCLLLRESICSHKKITNNGISTKFAKLFKCSYQF